MPFVGQQRHGINITTITAFSTEKHPVGTIALDNEGNKYVFVKATGTIPAKDAVIIDYADATTILGLAVKQATAANQQIAGIALVAMNTTTPYAFIMVDGKVTGANVDSTGVTATGVILCGSATAGRLSVYSAATNTGVFPVGLTLTTPASNTATVRIKGVLG